MKTKTYTAQQVFNKVVRHLRRQSAKALLKGTVKCLYLAPDGKRCAVGCLAKPGALDAYEGKGLGDVINGLANDRPNSTLLPVLREHKDLLRRLQHIHDGYDIDKWEEQFEIWAAKFNLTVPSKEVST